MDSQLRLYRARSVNPRYRPPEHQHLCCQRRRSDRGSAPRNFWLDLRNRWYHERDGSQLLGSDRKRCACRHPKQRQDLQDNLSGHGSVQTGQPVALGAADGERCEEHARRRLLLQLWVRFDGIKIEAHHLDAEEEQGPSGADSVRPRILLESGTVQRLHLAES